MAETSELVLLVSAKDQASAIIKQFGSNVEATNKQIVGSREQMKQASTATKGFATQMQESLSPMRRFQSVLGALGLTTFGLSMAGAMMGMKQMVAGALEVDRGLASLRLNFQRIGLTVDDANRMVRQFSSLLGRTAAAELAQIDEATLGWIASLGPMGESISKVAAEISKWTKTPLSEVLKMIKKDMDEAGDSIDAQGLVLAKWGESAKNAKATASDFQKTIEGFKDIWKPIGEGFTIGFLGLFTPAIWNDQLIKPTVEAFSALVAKIKIPFLAIVDWFKDNWYFMLLTPFIGIPVALAKDWIAANWDFLKEPFVALLKFFSEDFWGEIVETFSWVWGWLQKGWSSFTGFFSSLFSKSVDWAKGLWHGFGEWFGKLIEGIGNFWAGVWEGMKVFGISIYNFILDKFNDALAFANTVIRLINSALGKVGLNIPEIGFRFTPVVMPAPVAPVYAPVTLPSVSSGAGAARTIVVPISIGEKTIAELIIDTLTGEVKRRELSG